jgi:hypothetical protein
VLMFRIRGHQLKRAYVEQAILKGGMAMSSTQSILLWAIAILPGCIYFFVWFAYNRILAYKRKEIASLMRGGNAFQLYIKAFGGPVPITNKPDAELSQATLEAYLISTITGGATPCQ